LFHACSGKNRNSQHDRMKDIIVNVPNQILSFHTLRSPVSSLLSQDLPAQGEHKSS
jgi:hypothetical protein